MRCAQVVRKERPVGVLQQVPTVYEVSEDCSNYQSVLR